MNEEEYFNMRMREEEDYYKKNFGVKFWVINFLTLGFYGHIQIVKNARRIGLI